VRGRAQAGEVRILGHRENGWGVDLRVRDDAAGAATTLVLDAQVGFGDVEVVRA
jgi:hypothetical protein